MEDTDWLVSSSSSLAVSSWRFWCKYVSRVYLIPVAYLLRRLKMKSILSLGNVGDTLMTQSIPECWLLGKMKDDKHNSTFKTYYTFKAYYLEVKPRNNTIWGEKKEMHASQEAPWFCIVKFFSSLILYNISHLPFSFSQSFSHCYSNSTCPISQNVTELTIHISGMSSNIMIQPLEFPCSLTELTNYTVNC